MNRLFVVLILSFLLIACNGGDSDELLEMEQDDDISVVPVIDVAIVPNTPDYYLKGYHAEGFYIDILKNLKDNYKSYIRYVPCKNVLEAMMMIKDDKCDIACVDNIIHTGEAYSHIKFTQPLVKEKLVLVQRKDNPTFIHTPTQFKGDTVFNAGNPTIEPYLNNLTSEIGAAFISISNDTVSDIELVKMLNKGKIKYAIISSRYAKGFKSIFPNLDFSVSLSFESGRCWMYNSRNRLLQEEIEQLMATIDLTKKRRSNFIRAYNDRKRNISIYDDIIKEAAAKSSVNPYFIIALAYHESTFYNNLLSPRGAYGLLQLMPATLRKYGIDTTTSVNQQIVVGVKIIEALKSKYGKTVKSESDLYAFVLAAYNSGVGRLDEAIHLSKKGGFDKKLWWGNVENGMKYIRRRELILPDSTDENFKGHHTYYFVRNVMESYNHFQNFH